MKRSTLVYAAAALAAAAGLVVAAWWLGMHQGMAMMASPAAIAAAPADPSQWTIPQGEEATRRHVRDGLKAGDTDPVTGLRILNYHDPMVPGRNFEAPGKSPFMDMMLVPRYAGGDQADASTVSVSPRMQRNLGLRAAPVVEGTLAPEVAAVGNVAWNERLQQVVAARAMGFVEKLHVRALFDKVRAGAPLVELYVPDWVAAQEEYLALIAMRGDGLDTLRDAALARMRQVGMSEALIGRVALERRVLAQVTIQAPIDGVVTELPVREGTTVMAGMPLLRLQGTASVWAEGEVPESQAAALAPGMAVTATSPALPGRTFEGRVQSLLPQVDPATRTRRARLELVNAGGPLVPGMFVEMRFATPARSPTLLVPIDAVIHTGRRSVVMLAEDGGRFRPVEVRTGRETTDQVEILAGLQAGQQVVLSGQFLVDSEASLRGLEVRLNAGEPGAAVPPSAAPSPAALPTHRTDARVEAVDGDTVTLDHPPIASLQWPQMVMDFRLPPHSPAGLSPGDRVRVEFRMQEGDVPQITAIERLTAPMGGTGGTR
ncbi:efflux RND transporter periplasmic adaptor subunit [Rubrivivax albus]|uniref:Efflux RND transporter periplasmic adaptor subunit n=1 Tax=Rubrivivax albus TaxID=2499835 RepID=A0A3S2TP74_9BURK|nr:efflux RND transporter periplasmic adaptor subunit [Rubrivivax albus]RVT49640.1 efflux RND transporter periplasmic adaptor subunit [Rubrivivax albus]